MNTHDIILTLASKESADQRLFNDTSFTNFRRGGGKLKILECVVFVFAGTHPSPRFIHLLQEVETPITVESLLVRAATPRLQSPRFRAIMRQEGESFLNRPIS